MQNIIINYAVIRSGDLLLEGTVTVGLTAKNVKDTIAFIEDNHFSAELVDIPSDVYGRIYTKAEEDAIRTLSKQKDGLCPTDDLKLQELLPVELLNILPENILAKLDQDRLAEEYDLEEEQVEDEEEEFELPEVVTHYRSDEEMATVDPLWTVDDRDTPSKANSLYLTIRQAEFDKIVAGQKLVERREIKDTTFKKYLEIGEDGLAMIDEDFILDEDGISQYDIYSWNDGVYPFIPKDIQYLQLAVGYNKERDTALVEVVGFSFNPQFDNQGNIIRLSDDANGIPQLNANGNQCFWEIVFHLGKVLECRRH